MYILCPQAGEASVALKCRLYTVSVFQKVKYEKESKE